MKRFINDAKDGVILVSMGSMFRTESLPENIRTAFEKAFRRLPQRIIWKWENENRNINSRKILYMKWLPQRDVLGEFKFFINLSFFTLYCGIDKFFIFIKFPKKLETLK